MTDPATFDVDVLTPVGASPDPLFVARVRLRARRCVQRLRALWGSQPAAASPHVILDGEVDRLLADTEECARRTETAYEAPALAEAIAQADENLRNDERIAALRDSFGLSDRDVDMLTLAASVEVDPWLCRVFAYLHDDATRAFPTLWLARQVFEWAPSATIGAGSPLIRWRLAGPIESQGDPCSVHTPWAVDPYVAACLLGEPSIDPQLASVAVLVDPAFDGRCLYTEQLTDAEATASSLAGDDATLEIAFVGGAGAGKRTLARQLCARLGVPLLIVDLTATDAIQPARDADLVLRVCRAATLLRSAVYWHQADKIAPSAWAALEQCRLSILGVPTVSSLANIDSHVDARRVLQLPALTKADRVQLWTDRSHEPAPAPVVDWPLLPNDIARAASVATAGPDAVADACRPPLPADAAALLTSLPRPYVWDDLVLAPATRAHLREFEAQARLRWEVHEDWGIARSSAMGRGISALLAGPSGTGKTMTAQVVGRALGLEVYRVDLAGVVSKYVGETAKHLRLVFDACTRANVLLFFDEADALFGRRTTVSDAHDRFANMEVAYLLQRMETYDGISMLATNRRGDLDPAFLRRLRFIIDFLPPGPPERLELWRRTLPARSPSGEALLEEINWNVLAERLELTGAEIKAAGIGAAFLARDEGKRIEMRHVIHAVKRELAKRGKVLRAGDLVA